MEIKRYKTFHQSILGEGGALFSEDGREINEQEFRSNILARFGTLDAWEVIQQPSPITTATVTAKLEEAWEKEKKPFYRVYPSIRKSLCEIDLDSVNFQDLRLPHAAIAIEPVGEYPFLFGIFDGWGMMCFRRHDRSEVGLISSDSKAMEMTGDLNHLWTLAFSVALLHTDPDLVTPFLCKRHESQISPNTTPERINQLHQKSAKLIGGLGYHFGRSIEAMPHTRRPHPALMWTGKGRKTPKIILRKGCVVKRKKITQVPTGYRITGDSQIAAK